MPEQENIKKSTKVFHCQYYTPKKPSTVLVLQAKDKEEAKLEFCKSLESKKYPLPLNGAMLIWELK